jgi:CheY-like chemotaxis protein
MRSDIIKESSAPRGHVVTEVRELHLLILEHEALARWGVAAELRSLGYTVIEAHTVKEAVSIIESGTHIDVVFCDLDIPGDPSGRDFEDWLTRHEPRVPVLLTSVDANSGPTTDNRPTRAFMVKPYPIDTVTSWIAILLSLQKKGAQGK